MSNFSGLSAVLTVSLVAIVTIQLLKDNFQMIENYGDMSDDGDYLNAFTYTDTPPDSAKNINEIYTPTPPINNLNDEQQHGNNPLGTGDFFRPPYIAPNASMNGWNNFPEAFAVYQQTINAATPTQDQLDNIGAYTTSLPGPNTFGNNYQASANANSGRAANLSLCAQNYSTSGTGLSSVASSLLPNNTVSSAFEGFSDCNPQNSLANQVFLSHQAGGVMGTNTIGGSNKNSSLDIRATPPNPVLAVGPWNLSTIYPDLLRRPLEGCGPSFGLYGNGAFGSGVPQTIKQ
jgi:hypothetical protein